MLESLFIAKLSGRNEVPPVQTNAFGNAEFSANSNHTKLKFRLVVCNIENFIQAHIHFGAPDVNGPVLAFLFGENVQTIAEQEGLTTRKGVVTGVITDEDIVDNPEGITTVRQLVELMEEGLTYVNAHTEQNPDGEIRGQIEEV
ncbi:CHRD domain-containing protein [Alkalihalobacillus sp. AL-G]|uniref:CHRD domain-containing protein n=1 Tax=Alkalihalobacillus sp. AL-G TaxID=2926399 RepID=UPI00272B4B35|nr:CHRD domain-containing protein [Alkalihalobacillus sp. AL-G]WLD91772.1 CHRD domain-containing protein [Alkalihalobacillus sp. AL-G]